MSARIVLAEDEPDIRHNLQRLLRLEGFEVWAGSNGREALDLIREHRPDLVISDIMMPEMSGHDLARALRGDPQFSQLPLILLTARADHQDVREGMNLGADDYLTKPFQRGELLQSISSRLERAAARQRQEQLLAAQHQHRAYHDSVTELPNRSHFTLLLKATLENSLRQGLEPMLVGVSLDNLPQMLELLPTGNIDACVACMGQRMRGLAQQLGQLTGGQVVLARTAEDRFVFLLDRCGASHRNTEWLHPLWQACGEPLDANGERHFPKVAVGSLWLDGPLNAPDMALARLDMVLAQAQRQAGMRVCAHSLQSTDELRTEFRMHNALHDALPRQQLLAAYQPQVDTFTKQLVGFEALMRWQHPEWGLVSPARFIPLAEDNGQIVPMGHWMLLQACQQAAQWARDWQGAMPPPRVAVNLSLRQFGHPDLVRHVEEALDTSGLAPGLLELEVTEGTAMQDLAHTLKLLGKFKAMGLKLAIDDFGTGYSSLAYLKRFPLDVLKVDQSFVRNLCNDAEDRAIANAVIKLAHALDMTVIAEGVETEAQHAILRDMGCNLCQGYLFGRPMPANEATALLTPGQVLGPVA